MSEKIEVLTPEIEKQMALELEALRVIDKIEKGRHLCENSIRQMKLCSEIILSEIFLMENYFIKKKEKVFNLQYLILLLWIFFFFVKMTFFEIIMLMSNLGL